MMTYPYNNFNMGMKTPEQLAQEYNNLMQNYQNIYNANQMLQKTNIAPAMNAPAMPTNQVVSNTGDYKTVEKFADVETSPTRLDGTATLFFDFNNMVFWSKKFINGQHTIQAYKFCPINKEPIDTVEDKPADTHNEKMDSELSDTLKTIIERLNNLEKQNTKSNETMKRRVEVQDNELK